MEKKQKKLVAVAFCCKNVTLLAGAYKSDFGQLPLPQSTPLPQLQPQPLQLQSALTPSDEKSRQKAAAASASLPASHEKNWWPLQTVTTTIATTEAESLAACCKGEGGNGAAGDTAEAARPANCVFRGFWDSFPFCCCCCRCCPCCCCSCCYCCCCCWLLLLLFALRGVKMFVCINLQQTLMRLSMRLRLISSRLVWHPTASNQLAVPTPLLATPPHTHTHTALSGG